MDVVGREIDVGYLAAHNFNGSFGLQGEGLGGSACGCDSDAKTGVCACRDGKVERLCRPVNCNAGTAVKGDAGCTGDDRCNRGFRAEGRHVGDGAAQGLSRTKRNAGHGDIRHPRGQVQAYDSSEVLE